MIDALHAVLRGCGVYTWRKRRLQGWYARACGHLAWQHMHSLMATCVCVLLSLWSCHILVTDTVKHSCSHMSLQLLRAPHDAFFLLSLACISMRAGCGLMDMRTVHIPRAASASIIESSLPAYGVSYETNTQHSLQGHA
jgi:hypothetical protein